MHVVCKCNDFEATIIIMVNEFYYFHHISIDIYRTKCNMFEWCVTTKLKEANTMIVSKSLEEADKLTCLCN